MGPSSSSVTRMTWARIQMYLSCLPADLPQTIDLINEDIGRMLNWNQNNKLVLNASRTQAVLLGSNNSARIDISHCPVRICVNDINIEFSTEVKNLGIYIDESLKWGKQISEIQRKSYGTLRQLYYQRSSLPTDLRILLKHSFILTLTMAAY